MSVRGANAKEATRGELSLMETKMKKMLIAAVAIATAIASPALAASGKKMHRTGPSLSFGLESPRSAYAFVPGPTFRSRIAAPARRGWAVYDTFDGRYLGSDPDIHVRDELLRDPPARQD